MRRQCCRWLLIFVLLGSAYGSYGQTASVLSSNGIRHLFFDQAQYWALSWRNIGPFRGGRSVAVSGVSNDPFVYYMGSTGGGVWKTEDAGLSWRNVSDGYFRTGSVGAIAVSASDPNVVYAGMGEHAVRGVMSSHGDGVYKSVNGGQTWTYLGLPDSRHIAKITIHPQNPELVYLAVQGAIYSPCEDRGVYKSEDGGKTWRKVLYINPTTGASDLSMDVSNPRILYAGMWDYLRTPWDIRSGGPGSGLYRSTDGGENWEKLTQGLPTSLGKVAIDVSPANPKIVYANIEAEHGGVFRSNDGGISWKQVSADPNTVSRAWYFTEITADPRDPETVYVLNAPLLKSTDGGKNFEEISVAHYDQHAIWINPQRPENMILGNDGGATITFNGGKSWSSQYNQPTGQFYRVATDNRTPYYVYGGQQDYGTVALPSRNNKPWIDGQDWYPVSGGESAFLAFDPMNPELIYGTNYQGAVSVYDHVTSSSKDIMAYPVVGVANLPRDLKYRFNWNAPILVSPHNPKTLYHCANKVLRSEDGGINWKEISPDLTRNEKEKQGPGGKPFSNEGAGAENYNTIAYLACSPHEPGVIWAGSDDGLIHLTKDDGKHWKNVTPPNFGEGAINAIEVSPHRAGMAIVAAHRYKFGDLKPYIYITDDYGVHWKPVIEGIADEDFVRVVREDPTRPGLLYAGTEAGLYLSPNYGESWHLFQLNLPVCPVTDICIQDNDLVVSTSGRGFWILDDISSIQQSAGEFLNGHARLFQPKPTVRWETNAASGLSLAAGSNPQPGIVIDYYLPFFKDSIEFSIEILDASGKLVRKFSNRKDSVCSGGPTVLLPDHVGINRFYWDLRRESLPAFAGFFLPADLQGGLVAPGKYIIRLCMPNDTLKKSCTILPDPRLKAEPNDFIEQAEFTHSIEENLKHLSQALAAMKNVKRQMVNLKESLPKTNTGIALLHSSDQIIAHIHSWEGKLVQPKHKTLQDLTSFSSGHVSEWVSLLRRADSHDPRLTTGVKQRFQDLTAQMETHQNEMNLILNEEIGAFNERYRQGNFPAVILPPSKDADKP